MSIQLENTRNIQDASFITTAAFPAANGSPVNSTGLNLVEPYAMSEHFQVRIDVPALPNNIVSADSPTVTLLDSADGVNFAAIAELQPFTITGVASTGSAATFQVYALPPNTRQYIAIQTAVPTGSGNNTASSATLSIRF